MSSKRFVGFDSKRFTRGNFQALIGVGVTIADVDSYSQKYDELLSNFFKENGLEKRRPLYKSFDFSRLFFSKGYDVPEHLFTELSNYVSFIDVYYSYFTKPVNANDAFIKIFYKEETGVEKVTHMKFIDIIEHSYPAICAWRYLSKYASFNPKMYSDHLSAHPSNIWESLKSHQNYFIAYKGDQCNYLVNAADIFLTAIANRILKNDLFLNRQIHKILLDDYADKFETDFIGTKDLYNLAPSNKWSIDTSGRILHPVYFVFTEGNAAFQQIFPGQNENTFIEKSVFLDKLYSEATKNGGCVKIYTSDADNSLIREDDVFFYYGLNGKAKVDFLSNIGYANNVISAKELVKQK